MGKGIDAIPPPPVTASPTGSEHKAGFNHSTRLGAFCAQISECKAWSKATSVSYRNIETSEEPALLVGRSDCEAEGAATRPVQQVHRTIGHASAARYIFRPQSQRYPVFEIIVEQEGETVRA